MILVIGAFFALPRNMVHIQGNNLDGYLLFVYKFCIEGAMIKLFDSFRFYTRFRSGPY